MTSWEHTLISEQSFFAEWGATVSKTGDLFTFEDVTDKCVNFVWTVIESNSGGPNHWIAAPGFHVVNALGYVLTRQPWNDDTRDAFYWFDESNDSKG